jgi:hypothetical protein
MNFTWTEARSTVAAGLRLGLVSFAAPANTFPDIELQRIKNRDFMRALRAARHAAGLTSDGKRRQKRVLNIKAANRKDYMLQYKALCALGVSAVKK